jgi:uncharacterized protein (TIGR02246 family)
MRSKCTFGPLEHGLNPCTRGRVVSSRVRRLAPRGVCQGERETGSVAEPQVRITERCSGLVAKKAGEESGVCMSELSSVENALRAIDAVNQRDVQAALASDTAAMMSQWTDDFVLLQPAGPILRGRTTIADVFRGAESAVEILEYVLDIQEVKVLGEYAFQWGTFRYSLRPRAGGETVDTGGKLMRILERQPDGTWKIHRTISTAS